ncbi:hypothetical protein FB451DRAFT_1466515 [Mycena latifolia]|nr:hypothetical protein FB451DRAFT_1466515 [Mycena latifolia]
MADPPKRAPGRPKKRSPPAPDSTETDAPQPDDAKDKAYKAPKARTTTRSPPRTRATASKVAPKQEVEEVGEGSEEEEEGMAEEEEEEEEEDDEQEDPHRVGTRLHPERRRGSLAASAKHATEGRGSRNPLPFLPRTTPAVVTDRTTPTSSEPVATPSPHAITTYRVQRARATINDYEGKIFIAQSTSAKENSCPQTRELDVQPHPETPTVRERCPTDSEAPAEEVEEELRSPEAPYDRHFPVLSPTSEHQRRAPHRSPVDDTFDVDEIAYNPNSNRVTLSRENYKKLVASHASANMAKFSKDGNENHRVTDVRRGQRAAPPIGQCAKGVGSACPYSASVPKSKGQRARAQPACPSPATRLRRVTRQASVPGTREAKRYRRADALIEYSTVVKMPGAPSSPKVQRVISLNPGKVIDPHRLGIPAHVKTSLRGGFKTKQFSVGGVEFLTDEVERRAGGDEFISQADFITAGERLVEAIRNHFAPRNLAQKFASQMELHFKNIRRRSDFDTNFRRYRTYNTEVTKAWIEDPTFDISEWQSAVYDDVLQRDRDRTLETYKRQQHEHSPFRPKQQQQQRAPSPGKKS